MSPEQKEAWHAARHKQPIPTAVDGRSDVYSLGLLLREALYGELPETASARPDQHLPPRPDVSPGLREVLVRCLHRDPAARYPSAAVLAEDLRRHLTNRPLTGVRNRSFAERWRKWRRRRPHALTLLLLVGFCLATAAALGGFYLQQGVQQRRDAEHALTQGREQAQQGHYADAVRSFDSGLERLGGANSSLHAELSRQRQRAARAYDIETVHEQVERSRYLLGDELLSPTTLRALESQCHDIWKERDRLLNAKGEMLETDIEESLRRDLLDVAILWADCHVRLGSATEVTVARQEAVEVLNEAESLFGPSAVLHRQRGDAGAGPEPRTAWEYYTLGRWLLRAGDLDAAAEAFDRAVQSRPQDFWPWFGKGACAYQRDKPDEAVTAFTVCISKAPEQAACWHNRALALAATGDTAAAIRDCDEALKRDPHLAAAALNRGGLRLQDRRFTDAEEDFRLALSLGANPASVHFNWALLYQARGESAAAVASLERVLECDPTHRPSRELLTRLQKQLSPAPKPD
jgi:tetratricopeptide (TPR) repeat protein